jgi:hypothetical protein
VDYLGKDVMSDDPAPIGLPDDIKQKLLDGQRSRATHDLAERRRCTVYEARMLVSRRLFARGLAGPPKAGNVPWD